MLNHGRHPTVKHTGRKPGQPRQQVDPSEYPAMSQMELDGWGWGHIGKQFGVTPTTASRLVRKYRGEL